MIWELVISTQVNRLGVTNHLNFTKRLYPGVTEYEIVNLQYTGWEPVSMKKIKSIVISILLLI